jgi:hypothetical protein
MTLSQLFKDDQAMTITKNWVLIQLETQCDESVVDIRVWVDTVNKDLRNPVIGIKLAHSVHIVNEKSPITQLPALILLDKNSLGNAHQFFGINLNKEIN